MTTSRRLRRDRRRYNALRRVHRSISREIERIQVRAEYDGGFPDSPAYNLAARYNVIRSSLITALCFSARTRCACGRRRQNIRLE